MQGGDVPEPARDLVSVDKVIIKQGADEVDVLLAKGDQLGDAEVLLVQAPTGEAGLAGRRRGVGVLHLHETVAPAFWQDGRGEVDAIDAETVELLERGELAQPHPR